MYLQRAAQCRFMCASVAGQLFNVEILKRCNNFVKGNESPPIDRFAAFNLLNLLLKQGHSNEHIVQRGIRAISAQFHHVNEEHCLF